MKNKEVKEFDSVLFFREIKEKLALKMKGMTLLQKKEFMLQVREGNIKIAYIIKYKTMLPRSFLYANLILTLMCYTPALYTPRYVPEGNMTACGTDYLNKDWFSRSYLLVYGFFVYFLPLFIIVYSYWFIVKAVSEHEKSMKEQAKKMNMASLRSAENQATTAEYKLAKVITMLLKTPYM